jgi:hypothetical protein
VTTVSGDQGRTVPDATGAALLVYGVTRAHIQLPAGLTGVAGHEPVVVPVGRLGAVVGELPDGEGLAQRDNLLGYHAVVDAVAAVAPVVPLRFGTIVYDEAELSDDLLAPRARSLEDLLDSLEGRQQFNLRADYVPDVVLAEIVRENDDVRALRERTRGLSEDESYADRVRLGELVARAAEHKTAGDAAVLIESVLPWVAAHAVHMNGGGLERILDVALLVEDDQTSALEDHLEMLAEQVHDRVRLSLTGPLAPYDFVGEVAWDS